MSRLQLLIAVLLLLGLGGPVPALPLHSPPATLEPLPEPGSKPDQGEETTVAVLALVQHIDRQTNVVTLATEVGQIEALTSPEIVHELREGDLITVVLSEEEAPTLHRRVPAHWQTT